MKEKTVTFDVMLDGYYVSTFEYKACPPHPISERGLYAFVVSKLPTLRGKQFRIWFKDGNKKEGGKR